MQQQCRAVKRQFSPSGASRKATPGRRMLTVAGRRLRVSTGTTKASAAAISSVLAATDWLSSSQITNSASDSGGDGNQRLIIGQTCRVEQLQLQVLRG